MPTAALAQWIDMSWESQSDTRYGFLEAVNSQLQREKWKRKLFLKAEVGLVFQHGPPLYEEAIACLVLREI